MEEKKKPSGILIVFCAFALVAIIVAICIFVADATKEPTNTEPVIVSVDELYQALNDNTATAIKTYKNLYVQVTGIYSGMDSGEDYVHISQINTDSRYDTLAGRITKEQIEELKNLEVGQEITVTGTITNVSQMLGFFMDVETID